MNAQVEVDPADELYAGRCFYIPSGDVGAHLFVCVFEIKKVDGKDRVLLVPFCTKRDTRNEDDTCILTKGDHPFIRHDSYVSYSEAREEIVSFVMSRLAKKQLVPHPDDVSDALLLRIRAGLQASNRTKRIIANNWHLDG